MSEPYGTFPPPPPPPILPPPVAPAGRASSQAITALVFGILGVTCCGLMAPIAWYLGTKESKMIQAGLSPVDGAQLATAAKILGIIGTILLGVGLIWMFFMGGMVILQGLMHH